MISRLARPLTAAYLWARKQHAKGIERGSDAGDISITTVIIWVAAVTGALIIAGTIAVVISKYNGQLSGI
ncbi:hypothetical protein OG937_45845 [Streptomyces sp. NBC_00510]